MFNRIALFLLRLAVTPFVLALVIFVAWCFSFLLAAIGILEVSSKHQPVSTGMTKDFEVFLKAILVMMGLD